MTEPQTTCDEQVAELNRLIDEGRDSAENQPPVSFEELRQMLDDAKARRLRDARRISNAGQ